MPHFTGGFAARLRGLPELFQNLFFVPEGLSEGAEVKHIVRTGLVIIAVLVFGVGAWAVFAPLTGAVIAPGFVKVDMNRKVVQHQEGGIVKEVLVRDGQHVKQGQTLIVLDDVRVDAGLESLRQQWEAERAKAARLESERLLAPAVKFPPDLTARRSDPKLAEVLTRETELFRARREVLESQISLLRKQIKESSVEAAALVDQIAAEERAIKLQREELNVNKELQKQNFVANVRVLALERAVADYESRWGEHRAELSKTQQRVSELELRILSMRNSYVQQATDDLKESTSKIFDLDERLRPMKDAAERQRITAPATGEVVGLKVFSAGAVAGPRDTLMEIVPDVKTLIVEGRLKPEDINHVKVGNVADVRLTAYKQRTTQLVEGKVSYVSADRLTDPQGNAYYVVQVEVPHQALIDAGGLKMLAGMPAELYMRTDRRTAVDYLLAPVEAYFRKGMREPR
ncbi:MAG TPA: HlyD family type I secretion periplasmic adaptor subunit [Burkholderiales bacterium]|jgi:HlyD family type I secretion membrane fusion protein|nr:HlyD family type I secretion periplasmic adaptor subunit [Burkholderiales bacterium]